MEAVGQSDLIFAEEEMCIYIAYIYIYSITERHDVSPGIWDRTLALSSYLLTVCILYATIIPLSTLWRQFDVAVETVFAARAEREGWLTLILTVSPTRHTQTRHL